MQLDRTEIIVRRRNSLELLDLALLVLKRHWRPVFASSLIVGLPLLLLNIWATAWLLGEDALLAAELLDAPQSAMQMRHVAHLLALYAVQFPLASLPTSIVLGSLIFYTPIGLKDLLRRLKPIALRSVFLLGIVRLGLPMLLMQWLVNRSAVFDWSTEVWLLIVFPATAITIRAFWPHAPEILGLELCPLFTREKHVISYSARSRRLHGPLFADHFTSFAAAVIFGILLTLMLIGIQLWFVGVFTGYWGWGSWCNYFALPVSLWVVGQFLAVHRFLGYLDSRIGLEGWEIELQLRAEASRLAALHAPPHAGQLKGSLGTGSGLGGELESGNRASASSATATGLAGGVAASQSARQPQ